MPFLKAIVIPEKLRLHHKVRYPTLPCHPDALNKAGDILQNNINRLECIQEGKCFLERRKVEGCDGQRNKRDSGGVTTEVVIYAYEEDSAEVNVTRLLQDGKLGNRVKIIVVTKC